MVPASGSNAVFAPAGGNVLGGGGPLLDWSPSGEWIAYASTHDLRLVSPDGQRQRVLVKKAPAVFGFSKTGKQIYGLRRAAQGVVMR